MRLKKLLSLFILAFTFIKPSMATVKPNKAAEGTSKAENQSSSKQLKRASKHASRKKDYMHGVASYYGKGDNFNGRTMADGETFDTYDMFVAAHPTLPLGTKLKVINNSNGKIAYVEIKDRMPRGRRVIDLSYAAAGEIGMQHRGLSRVTLVKIDNSEFYKHKQMIEDMQDTDSDENKNPV